VQLPAALWPLLLTPAIIGSATGLPARTGPPNAPSSGCFIRIHPHGRVSVRHAGPRGANKHCASLRPPPSVPECAPRGAGPASSAPAPRLAHGWHRRGRAPWGRPGVATLRAHTHSVRPERPREPVPRASARALRRAQAVKHTCSCPSARPCSTPRRPLPPPPGHRRRRRSLGGPAAGGCHGLVGRAPRPARGRRGVGCRSGGPGGGPAHALAGRTRLRRSGSGSGGPVGSCEAASGARLPAHGFLLVRKASPAHARTVQKIILWIFSPLYYSTTILCRSVTVTFVMPGRACQMKRTFDFFFLSKKNSLSFKSSIFQTASNVT
jgi:hypothetical protein